jgi:transposase
MAFLGLVPSEHSSGGHRSQGGLTKAGNSIARRMLIEAALSYRFPERISRDQWLRQERLPRPIRQGAMVRVRLWQLHVVCHVDAPGEDTNGAARLPISLTSHR